jgi:hypothetical protein
MPYDPQRSHRRPQLADDAPAPIDALLGAPSDVGDAEDASAEAPAAFVDEIEVVGIAERGRPRVALLAIALVVVLLVLAWVRRRAPRR